GITGKFAGVANGAEMTVNCSGFAGTAPTVRINYTPNTVTATVLTSGGSGIATTTSLAVSSTTPAANENVTYTATVTPAQSGPPSGSVEFLDGGIPIEACSNQQVIAAGSSAKATCTLSYPAGGTHSITATYLGDSTFAGSTSGPPQTVAVQEGSGGGSGNNNSNNSSNTSSNNGATTATTGGGV